MNNPWINRLRAHRKEREDAAEYQKKQRDEWAKQRKAQEEVDKLNPERRRRLQRMALPIASLVLASMAAPGGRKIK